ncbi:Cell differentiation protein RCD1 [Ascosphaera pollenicola]|nr:Cell differentiation protein RCD1 [Ascosphaera pollenicola]
MERTEKAMNLPLSDSNNPCWVDCNKCGKRTSECHYHCDECDNGDFDLCPFCIDSGATCHDNSHFLVKRFMRDGLVVNQAKLSNTAAASPQTTNEPLKKKTEAATTKPVSGSAPKDATHHVQKPAKTSGDRAPVEIPQWVCNGCVRELSESASFVTCVNCHSFDLCLDCLVKDKHGHNPFHEFRLNNKSGMTTYRSQDITKLCRPGRDLTHDAYCDGCDRRIHGIRHKCLDCPDWDFCDTCAKSARINHPGHRFARLTNSIDLAWKAEPVHKGILCDGPFCAHSQSYITGVRYKCTVCHDTDFCQVCEAHPSNRHNETHPLIKIRTPVASLTVTTVHESAKSEDPVALGDVNKEKKGNVRETSASGSTVIDAATQVEAVVSPSTSAEQKKQEQPVPDATPKPVAEVIAPLTGIFVGDTVPDGSKVYADQSFTQTWSVFNPGPKPWPKGVTVHYVGGDTMFDVDMTRPVGTNDLMAAMRSEPTEQEVGVFKTHKFTVKMKAPSRVITGGETDRRISVWAIKDAEGKAFGHKLWCDVVVLPSSFDTKQDGGEEVNKDLEKSEVIFPVPEQSSTTSSSTTAVSPEPSLAKPEIVKKAVAPADGLDIEDLSYDVHDLSIENTDYSYDTEDANSSSSEGSFLTDDEFEVLSEEEIEASMRR